MPRYYVLLEVYIPKLPNLYIQPPFLFESNRGGGTDLEIRIRGI